MEAKFSCFVPNYYSIALYLSKLDSSLIIPDSDCVRSLLLRREHYDNVCKQVSGFLGKLVSDDFLSEFGYGVVYVGKTGKVFYSFCLFSFYNSFNFNGWASAEFAVPIFLSRALDMKSILFTNVLPENERRTEIGLCVSYGSANDVDCGRFFDVVKSISGDYDGITVASYYVPFSVSDSGPLFISLCMRDDDQFVYRFHDYYVSIGFTPNTISLPMLPYVFDKRSVVDNVMRYYEHVDDRYNDIIRAPAGGAISQARHYKGGQFIPGKRTEG